MLEYLWRSAAFFVVLKLVMAFGIWCACLAWEARKASWPRRQRSEDDEWKVQSCESWRVYCNCSDCCAWRASQVKNVRVFKGERLTVDVPKNAKEQRRYLRAFMRRWRKARRVWLLRPWPRLTRRKKRATKRDELATSG